MNIDTVYKQLQEMRLTRMAEQLQDRLANGEHKTLTHENL